LPEYFVFGRRFVSEVAADHLRELVQRFENGEVQFREKIAREHKSIVAIQYERF
jgi:hypothetical protein